MKGCKHLANKLRKARTVHQIAEMNEAVTNGELVIFIKRETKLKFMRTMYVFRNINTGEFAEDYARSTVHQYAEKFEYPEEEWEILSKHDIYSNNRKINDKWGAYILPADAEVGERFYIEETLEDILLTNFWGPILASDAVGIWNGNSLEIDHDAFYRPTLVG